MRTPNKPTTFLPRAAQNFWVGWVKMAHLHIVCMDQAVLVGVEWGRQVPASGGVLLSCVAADAESRPFEIFESHFLKSAFLMSGPVLYESNRVEYAKRQFSAPISILLHVCIRSSELRAKR